MHEVTVTISSYDRIDLLEICLKSFKEFNTYPIKRIIVVEDSQKPEVFKAMCEMAKAIYPEIEMVYNETNLNVTGTYDKMMQLANTEFVFRVEEDYKFIKPGFIEKSIDLLEFDKNIFQVHIRSQVELPHPCEPGVFQTARGVKYMKLMKNIDYVWDGISNNTGMRRKSHYNLCAPYAAFAQEEAAVNAAYRKWPDMYSVLLFDDGSGFCTHSGGVGRSAVFRGVGAERAW